jgi:demethylmenaquinone methyltransferase/2-methoxy-6-polyprenyl-1,4-benzoquinol methylase
MSAPHEPILTRYDSADEKNDYVTDLFNRGAAHYDRSLKVGFFGTGQFYRKRALLNGGLAEGMKVIDVACGTGAVTIPILEVVGETGSVLGVDPSESMLSKAKKNIQADFKIGRAETLPAKDDQFDFLSMGYALRHVEDLVVVFEEYKRVLKPGGKLLILEVSRPKSSIGLFFTKLYLRDFVPFISRVTSGSKDAREMMAYFWETIEACVPPEEVLAALKETGFQNVNRRTELGIFSEYRAEK